MSFASTGADVDDLATRIQAAGATLESEPHDTQWNSRAFEVADPSGYLLTIYSEE